MPSTQSSHTIEVGRRAGGEPERVGDRRRDARARRGVVLDEPRDAAHRQRVGVADEHSAGRARTPAMSAARHHVADRLEAGHRVAHVAAA